MKKLPVSVIKFCSVQLVLLLVILSNPHFAQAQMKYHNRIAILKNITIQPPVLQLDVGNLSWQQGLTLFIDREGNELKPGAFLKNFHECSVELQVNDEGIVVQVHPIDY